MVEINEEVFEALAPFICDCNEDINVEITTEFVNANFTGSYQVEIEYEDDYYGGTGASYFSYCDMQFICTTYDEYGDEIENDYCNERFEEYLKNS